MKKSLVLAMAMAMGVTASVYAANPFSDVPAGHWAYDSISKLAAAGIIEGYGDETFRGDRLMTRYEMAQIVAKALAKGANVDKLAAEFAEELDALGVRVAALEKKSDNVKITGQMRYRWGLGSAPAAGEAKQRNHDLRSRLWFNGKVNDNWTYVGMIQNVQNFKDNVGNETTDFQRAFLKGRLGGAKITAGRYHEELVGGDLYSNQVDGVKVEYGSKVRLAGYYGKLAPKDGIVSREAGAGSRAWGASVKFDIGKNFDIFAGYDEIKSAKDDNDERIKRDAFNVGANASFKDFGLTAVYLHGKKDDLSDTDKKNGYNVELRYKGAKAAKPGSWGLSAKYYDQGNLTYWNPIIVSGKGAFLPPGHGKSGFKGIRVGGDYTLTKNMVARVAYFDLKAKDDIGKKIRTGYGELIVTF